ncbi:MAG TPA: recombinase family protein [Clostridia bacterium]|nr:recombinase family protein [Clostridia bacterium]
MNAVIYARYSSDKQTEQSIDGQLRCCKEYAERNGYRVVGEYIDRALSGTSDNRPAFQEMIADSSKKTFQYVIVWKLDRFARNRYDSAIYKNKLKKNGVRVLSATEGIGEGDESIILEAVLEAMAETYSRQLSQNVMRGLKESALKANSTGGVIPLGYRLENGKLVIEEVEAEAVKLIFERYAAGVKKKAIAEELNNKGYKTGRGCAFNINSFRTVLNNRKYIGVFKFDDIEVEGGCPAIIDKELFDRCAKRALANRRAPARGKAKVEYLLTGKLFCGYCGAPMVGDSGTSATGSTYHYYSCSTRKRRLGVCDKKREKKDFLEWYVVEQTLEYVLTPERIEHIASKVVEAYNREFNESGVRECERRSAALLREFDQLAATLIRTENERMIKKINEKAETLELRINDTECELAGLRAGCGARITAPEIVEWLKSFCKGDLMDMEFRRRIIDVLVNAIYLYDDKVVLYYNIKDGKQVSYIEMLEDLESSDIDINGSPKRPKSELVYTTSVFGALIFRDALK